MRETKRRLKVFLCHAHSDVAAVRDLYRYLKREGVDVWLDKEKLLPGADWDFEIRKGVRESDVVVVCLSKQFNQAGYRQKEVRIALDTAMEKPEGEIFIIPARLEECNTLESLRKWHWVDLFEDGGRQKLIYALRARGESVSAALRRQRAMSLNSSATKGRDGEKKTKSPNVKKSDDGGRKKIIRALRTSGEKVKASPHKRRGDRFTGSAEGTEIQRIRKSGISIDDKGYVWNDLEILGQLWDNHEKDVLYYLIANKGRICRYEELYRLLGLGESEFSFESSWRRDETIKMVDRLISRLKTHIKLNSKQHEFLVHHPEGYILIG